MSAAPGHPDYPYWPIAYHDSWISVDPIVGCQMGCRYCFLQIPGWALQKPNRFVTISDAVGLLLTNPYFRANLTAIAFGNQTDPFLPVNVQETERFILRLDAEGLKNPLVLVTKKRIPPETIKKLRSLRNIRPIVFLSYSDLGPGIEPRSKRADVIANLRQLCDIGARVVHYWRPIVAANTTEESIDRTLSLFAPNVSSAVYIGLKVSPRLREVYARHPDLVIPQNAGPRVGDYLPQRAERMLRSVAAARYPQFPLYKHASCAVSLALGEGDYNGTWYRPSVCHASVCPVAQRKRCGQLAHRPEPSLVTAAMASIRTDLPFRISPSAVTLDGTIDQEQLTYLLHYLRFPVRARRVLLTRLLKGSIFTNCEDGNARTRTHDRRADEANQGTSRAV